MKLHDTLDLHAALAQNAGCLGLLLQGVLCMDCN